MRFKRSKFNAVRETVDNITFHSKREAARYRELKMLEKCGKITDLRLQVPYEIVPAAIVNQRKRRALRYIADFVYKRDDGVEIINDVKGYVDKVYAIKRHIMATLGHIITETK